MSKILRHVHLYWCLFCLVFFFVLFAPIYFICTRHPALYGFLDKARTVNAWMCTALGGLFFRFIFEEKFDRHKSYIYCANHTSSIDIILFCMLARGKYHFMGKMELMENPFWGMFFRTIDIPVSRVSNISAFRAFKKAGENLDKGMSLIIFPEGLIGEEYPPQLHEFKNGPFRLGIEHGVPIVPVTINIWKLFWDDGKRFGTRPGICEVFVDAPIQTTGLSKDDSEALKQRVFDTINKRMKTYEDR